MQSAFLTSFCVYITKGKQLENLEIMDSANCSQMMDESDCDFSEDDYPNDPSFHVSESNSTSSRSSSTSGLQEQPGQEQDVQTRWRTNNPSRWRVNINKERRRNGLVYTNTHGKKMPAKMPKNIEGHTCKFKCSENFNEDDRKLLCGYYNSLPYERQKDFLNSAILCTNIKRERTRSGKGIPKTISRSYNFKKNGLKVRVCKVFFCKTLCISHGPVDTMSAKVTNYGIFDKADKRGKNIPKNKTSPEMTDIVKNHIQKFPAMESHYCRKSSKRLYLDSNLSITKMHDLYKSECTENKQPYVSAITYRRIFCTSFNLSFFKPKKDQCLTCVNYAKADNATKVSLEKEYKEHIQRRDNANNEKACDKERACSDSEFVCATFDLQSVLQIPSGDVSQLYYSRKLNAYNATIYESAPPNHAKCFCWTEIDGQRGSCEIATALLLYLENLPSSIKKVSLFSDTCTGQNRNQYVSCMFLYAVRSIENLEWVEHKFMEKGHSYMEVDSMHSSIESAKKHVSVYCMQDWINIFHVARSNRLRNKRSLPYNVQQLKHKDFIDFKKMAEEMIKNRNKDTCGEQVNWLKIKRMRYEKATPNIIKFSYDFSTEYRRINIQGKGRPQMTRPLKSQLYKNKLTISSLKKNDLLKLCRLGVIPEEYHGWYRELPSDIGNVNYVGDQGVNSDCCDSEED